MILLEFRSKFRLHFYWYINPSFWLQKSLTLLHLHTCTYRIVVHQYYTGNFGTPFLFVGFSMVMAWVHLKLVIFTRGLAYVPNCAAENLSYEGI